MFAVSEPGFSVVPVIINGQQYAVRSRLDERYVLDLAAYLDDRMQAASAEIPNAEPGKIAILAALNIADELFRQREEDAPGQLKERTEKIERLLDRALAAGG